YVRTTLNAPMVVGQTYEVGFWFTNGVSTIHPYGINHFGVAFSTAPLLQSCGAQIVYTPQVEYPGVLYSTTWQYVSLLITPTQAFQYMCIGDFVPFASTTYQSFGGPGSSGSYYYIDDVSVQPLVSLPVELLTFDVLAEGNDAHVLWSTASEHNVDRFDVERSRDLLTWELAGSVPAGDESLSMKEYAMMDRQRPAGTDYYRLAQIEHDGSVRRSEMVAVTFSGGDPWVVWPQPSDGAFQLTGAEGADLIVIDELGQQVQAQVSSKAGSSVVQVQLRNAVPGIYLLSDRRKGETIRVMVDPSLRAP
ncbi:MAG TPA: hypothetical protein PK760_10035, partial [Flavobacteriales bacterium]|nr:hypothetical protein [Flavobacteriales bacterium]